MVFPPGFTNRDGDPLPLIVQKGAGGFNYATSDLACVIDRVERLGADLILYVVGAPQQQHFQMVFAVAEMAGWLAPPREAVHVAFGNVLGTDRKMLKSRTGESMKFVELLDEALERAAVAIDEKNPDLTAEQRAETVHMIGIGAVKYADLSTDRVKDYVFDWDRMLSFDGNTGPYLQYAHARICSIFRRADIDRASVRDVDIQVGTPQERALALRLLAYPTAIDTTLETLQPAQAVHLRVRPGDRLHRVLRALPGAQGRRAAALQPARARRSHRSHAAARPRPARHRRPGADVTTASPRAPNPFVLRFGWDGSSESDANVVAPGRTRLCCVSDGTGHPNPYANVELAGSAR